MNHTLARTAALSAILLALAAAPGCGIKKRVKKMFNPTASVLGVHVVEDTPQQTVIRVDVKTDDVDLLLGFVKMRYQVSFEETAVDGNDDVRKEDLHQLDNSGLSFLVTLRHAPGEPRQTEKAIRIGGAIVIKLIAEIATIPFEYRGVISTSKK